MGRFENAIVLAKASFAVLRQDTKLAVLPLLSGVVTLLVAATFVVPLALLGGGAGGYDATPVVWLLASGWYVVSAFVVVFFNAALVYAADARLHGHSVSIGEALRFASSRAHVLLPWALVSATVSVVLRAIEERAGVLGRIVGAIAGVAWSLVTFLVLPVLVVEGLGPMAALKRSGELFKRTWGEQVVSSAGIGLLALAAIVAGAVPTVLLVAAGGPLAIMGVIVFGLWVVACRWSPRR
jgi:hypothetical protein